MDAWRVTALVLSGGRATRMGGVDKGLQLFHGIPLVQHAVTRIAPQVDSVLINANRHVQTYQAWGYPVLQDHDPEFAGPLAGFLAGLAHCQTPYLLTVPCDCPRFPTDLALRLKAALEQRRADIAVAMQGGRTQPVFCLMRKDLLPSLQDFMRSGKRKIDAWTAQHKSITVDFDRASDDPQAFANVNTMQELAALQAATTLR